MNAPAYAVQICKIRPDVFRFENPMTHVVGINPFRTAVPFWGQTTQTSSSLSPKRDCGSKGVKANIRRLMSWDFQSKHDMLSKFKILSTTANSSRNIDELDGDSCIATLLRARRAVGASIRGQTTVGRRGLGPRDQEKHTWRAPLRG